MAQTTPIPVFCQLFRNLRFSCNSLRFICPHSRRAGYSPVTPLPVQTYYPFRIGYLPWQEETVFVQASNLLLPGWLSVRGRRGTGAGVL